MFIHQKGNYMEIYLLILKIYHELAIEKCFRYLIHLNPPGTSVR